MQRIRASRQGPVILPRRSVSLSGRRASAMATAKNASAYTGSTHPGADGKKGVTAISNDVEAVRGMASPGPMER